MRSILLLRLLPLLLTLFLADIAGAQSALVGKRLISVGDSATRARDAAGDPDRLDKIPGDEAQPPMEIWTYQRKGRVITLWLVQDKVVQVEDKRAAGESRD
ncbi:MAG TPA: hypothetical protein PLN91_03660 [Rhodanobacteraceae bacterium]|nr:hypothetical protein [Rhodanobacteraceae bacterium]